MTKFRAYDMTNQAVEPKWYGYNCNTFCRFIDCVHCCNQ